MSNDDFDLFEEDFATSIEDVPTGGSIAIELDAERHVIFESQQSAYGAAKEVLSAKELLAANEVAAHTLREKKKELQAAKEALQREYGAKLQEIAEALNPIDTQLFDLTRERRKIEHEVQGAEQRLRDALAFMKQQEQYKDNIAEFDKRSAGAFWREHAKDYQIDGARAIANANGCAILADKMGLGKTLTSQAALDMMGSKRVLIIVPDDIVSNFLSEVAHWAPHRTAFLLGKMTKAQRDITIGIMHSLEQFTGIINYSAWRRDKSLLTKLTNLKFDTVILDEAHNVKNIRTAAFKGVKQIIFADNTCPNCGGNIQHVHDSGEQIYTSGRYMPRDFYVCIGTHKQASGTVDFLTVPVDNSCGWSQRTDISMNTKREYGATRSIKHVIPMTGTPILNKPQDLFPLLHFIDPKNFDDERSFLYAYCQQNVYTDKWEFRSGGLDSLTKQLAGRYIARNRDTAGVVLPPQEIKYHNIEMDKDFYPDQYRVMEQLSKHAMIVLNSGDKLPIVAMIALITRKRQANVWPAGIEIRDPKTDAILFSVGEDVNESIKLDRIIMRPDRTESGEWEGMIPDFTGNGDKTNGERVVVFSQFKGPLKELEARLNEAGISVVRFDGDTPEQVRNEVKRDFDRKHLSGEDADYKWQVVLANYRTGGVGLNFTAATQMIVLDEEWNVGKNEQAYARIDRIGQTEENSVHILRLQSTVDTWMAELIENKRNMVEGFETNAEMANDMLKRMQNGDMI